MSPKAKTETFAVLLDPPARLDLEWGPGIIAEVLQESVINTQIRLRQCYGIIAENLDKERADIIALALTAKQMPARAIPQKRLVSPPRALPVNAMRFDDDALILGPIADEPEATVIAGEAIVLLTAARVRISETVSLYEPASRARDDTMQDIYTLDFIEEGAARRFRILASEFLYLSTGLPVCPTSYDNFRNLAAAIVERVPECAVDEHVRFALDDNPRTFLSARGFEQFDQYQRWRLSLRELPPLSM